MSQYFRNNNILVNQLKKSNKKAYSYLIKNYHKRLFTYAYNLSNNYCLAEDLVQNVFLNVWKKRQKLNPKLSIKAFLFKSIYNDFINQLKNRKVVSTLEKEYFSSINSQIPYDDNDSNSAKKLLIIKKRIEKLPPKCKRVFLLSKQEGLSNLEISEYLAISIKTVENQITKAFSAIKKGAIEEFTSLLFLFFRRIHN